jgi:transcriptional regulator with XRE-family HTH domain
MDAEDREAADSLGERVRKFRSDRGMSLGALASKADLSKSYISAIEHGEAPRASGRTLYAIAEALGVTMSDLLGRQLLTNKVDSSQPLPPSLLDFAAEHQLPESDVHMLAGIEFRGEKPKSKERWAHIYSAIRGTEWMDRGDGPAA